MAKISVRHGVASAYGLLLGRPFTIVGLTWLPAVAYAEGAGFLIRRMSVALAAGLPATAGLPGQYAFFYLAGLVAATALFGAVIAVPLTREALGLREERVAVHLVIGPRELKMFWALLRYYALIGFVFVAFALAAGLGVTQVVRIAAQHSYPKDIWGFSLETWLNSVAATAAVLLFLSFAVRFGFFLGPIAAAEQGVRLSRAKGLARGNFWSLAATMALAALPATAVLCACEATFGGIARGSHFLLPSEAGLFAAILAGGLVVLHALFAGASAGLYSEMAEASQHDAVSAHMRERSYDPDPTYDIALALGTPPVASAAIPAEVPAAAAAAPAGGLPATVLPAAGGPVSEMPATFGAEMSYVAARLAADAAVVPGTGTAAPQPPLSYVAARQASAVPASASGAGLPEQPVSGHIAQPVSYVAARRMADSVFADARNFAYLSVHEATGEGSVSYYAARKAADGTVTADEGIASYAPVRQAADAALLPATYSLDDQTEEPAGAAWMAPPPAAHFGTDRNDLPFGTDLVTELTNCAEGKAETPASSGAMGEAGDVPDHAQHAEFPAPPATTLAA